MQVADRCRLSPEQLRNLRPGAPDAPKSPQAPKSIVATTARVKRPPVPRPELEALRLVVHHPTDVAGRIDIELFSSDLSREAFEELASAMTLADAIDAATPEVADLLAQLAVEDTVEDPGDVVRRLVEQAATRALDELRRDARSATPSAAHNELAQRSGRLRLALEALRSVERGPDYEKRLDDAECQLLALLLGSPSMTRIPGA